MRENLRLIATTRGIYGHESNDGSWIKVELLIDSASLMKKLGPRAFRNKNGKTHLAAGAVVVKAYEIRK